MSVEEKVQTGKDKKAAADELFRKGDFKGGGYACIHSAASLLTRRSFEVLPRGTALCFSFIRMI